jgi:hypothetical protein
MSRQVSTISLKTPISRLTNMKSSAAAPLGVLRQQRRNYTKQFCTIVTNRLAVVKTADPDRELAPISEFYCDRFCAHPFVI